jgi:hypothetical protein
VRILLLLILCTSSLGCLIRRPIQVLYCDKMDSTGKHCAVWAHPVTCVDDAYGDCTPSSPK